MKSYEGLESPAFNQHVYTDEDDFRALRRVMERGTIERLPTRAGEWRVCSEKGGWYAD